MHSKLSDVDIAVTLWLRDRQLFFFFFFSPPWCVWLFSGRKICVLQSTLCQETLEWNVATACDLLTARNLAFKKKRKKKLEVGREVTDSFTLTLTPWTTEKKSTTRVIRSSSTWAEFHLKCPNLAAAFPLCSPQGHGRHRRHRGLFCCKVQDKSKTTFFYLKKNKRKTNFSCMSTSETLVKISSR